MHEEDVASLDTPNSDDHGYGRQRDFLLHKRRTSVEKSSHRCMLVPKGRRSSSLVIDEGSSHGVSNRVWI